MGVFLRSARGWPGEGTGSAVGPVSCWGLQSHQCLSLLGASDWGYKKQGVETKTLTCGGTCHLGQSSINICEADPGLPARGASQRVLYTPTGSSGAHGGLPKELTVEAVWATLDSNRSRGTSDQALMCQVCALIQTHGGDKASHVERCEVDKKVCQVPTGSWH